MSAHKLTFLPIKYSGRYGFWRIFYLLILGLLAGGVMFTFYFIYQNIYNTLTNTRVIIAIKSDMNWFSLDLEAYERAKSMIEQKKSKNEIPTNLKNIFFYNSNTITSSTYGNTSSTTQ